MKDNNIAEYLHLIIVLCVILAIASLVLCTLAVYPWLWVIIGACVTLKCFGELFKQYQ